MTRSEFDAIDTFDDLLDAAESYECHDFDDVMSQDVLDSKIDERIRYWDDSWQDLRYMLNDVPDYGDWFIEDEYGEYRCIDSEFRYFKETLEQHIIDCGGFDLEEDEDDGDFFESIVEEVEEPFEMGLDFGDFLTPEVRDPSIVVTEVTQEDEDEAEALLPNVSTWCMTKEGI